MPLREQGQKGEGMKVIQMKQREVKRIATGMATIYADNYNSTQNQA
ncbi:MAG: hypothetical protein M0Z43_09665 [Acidithiobacillus sp.]|nr:hypothetical protein [Acidithiobacillus sp.]